MNEERINKLKEDIEILTFFQNSKKETDICSELGETKGNPVFNHLLKEGYIKESADKNNFYKLTNDGRKKLENTKRLYKKEKRRMILNSPLVTILISVFISVFASFIITFFQISESRNSNNIYEQPVRPKIIMDQYYTDIPAISSTRIAGINGDESVGLNFPFYISNLGQMSSGPLSITFLNDWASSYEPFILQNLESMNKTFGQIHLTTLECWNWKYGGENLRKNESICEDSKKNIPIGFQKLNFRVDCTNCEPRIFNMSLDICIGSQHGDRC
jgi:predicted transcriptional regulator